MIALVVSGLIADEAPIRGIKKSTVVMIIHFQFTFFMISGFTLVSVTRTVSVGRNELSLGQQMWMKYRYFKFNTKM